MRMRIADSPLTPPSPLRGEDKGEGWYRLRIGCGESKNDRGVALLIALVVTALLIALIFEFAYATRVSLRAAVNFRDSQRAYFLARSGVNFVGMLLSDNLKNNKPRENLEQREWQTVPIISGGDTELRVRWEDEKGKINISTVNSIGWVEELFQNQVISTDVMDKIKELLRNRVQLRLLSELHTVMADEDYDKVAKFLTVNSDNRIDVNTASEEVLKAVLARKNTSPATITANRPYKDLSGTDINTGNYDTTSDYFKVYSYATVGNYTKQVEAVIQRSTSGINILYWRAL